ncbi:phenylalanine 4-hydroxylase [Pontibacter ummariensis]|uniref:Phenylalanine 4-hydroxylase n=1 Tax=Pontibacter ummariensis TaxID=1610492 RepID=A0A239F1L6_9BACT|nr:phenylalanine 4-monooxygenase [Pontibacter ummariensis]PRY12670.1 phenylalanine 4-hydroxylase [Pontibacter ummariensis]SNS49984.1 Phenylalanine 4-hydroxylase [Pontibacter ummariensis]
MHLTQNYSTYTEENHQVWSILFDRQIKNLPDKAVPEFMKGLQKVGFKPDRIPNFAEVNERLKPLTGFEVVPAPGIVDDALFFGLIADKKFPATVWIRKMEQLDYLEEPDMFHDVFGHVPLLTIPVYCEFLAALSAMALEYLDRPDIIDRLTRIYWYTIEFGLFRKPGEAARIYGAGILSSVGESNLSVSAQSVKHGFDVQHILDTPYIKETYQSQYFCIESFDQLLHSLPQVAQAIQKLREELTPVS